MRQPSTAEGRGSERCSLSCSFMRTRPSRRDRLIEALWGDDPPARAANALQVHVHGVRNLLGRDRLETMGSAYVLRVEPGELDIERSEELVRQARAADDPTTRLALLRSALALWRGSALSDLTDAPFAWLESRRLEEVRLAALELRIEAELALGHYDGLVGELETLVAAHPYRERLRAQLMVALYRAGRQADALATFQQTRRVLVDELGIEPSRELRDLERAILRQDPALAETSLAPAGTATSARASYEAHRAAAGGRRRVRAHCRGDAARDPDRPRRHR